MNFAPLVPEYVTDLARSLDFYVGLLGFSVAHRRPDEGFAFLELGGAQLTLEQTESLEPSSAEDYENGRWRTGRLEPPLGRGVNFEVAVTSVAALADRLRGAEYPLLLRPQEKTYRVGGQTVRVMRLLVADPDGYLLRLSETLSGAPVPNG